MDGWEAFDAIEGIGMEKVQRLLASGFAWLLSAATDGRAIDPVDLRPWAKLPAPPPPTGDFELARVRAGLVAMYG